MVHVVLPLLCAGAMPFVFTGIAKAGSFMPKDNHETRRWQSQLTGWRQRAHWAQLNSFEAFPVFAAGVIVAHLAAPGSSAAAIAAWGFIAARVVYGVCFITDQATLRSLVWTLGIACTVALYVIALMH